MLASCPEHLAMLDGARWRRRGERNAGTCLDGGVLVHTRKAGSSARGLKWGLLMVFPVVSMLVRSSL